MRNSSGATDPASGTGRLTAGFGASTLVAAGTYRITAFAGELDHIRDTYHTFQTRLMTIGGTAWEALGSDPIVANLVVAYVNPNGVGAAAEWVESTVEYVVPEGHALIGEEFTWGFTWAIPATANGFFAGFDAATVQFQAIPEPSAALLGGLGLLALLRRRRA